jgi:hypothetical protein
MDRPGGRPGPTGTHEARPPAIESRLIAPPSRLTVGLVAVLGLALVACGESLATRRLRAEERRLKRQIENVKEMIQATSERRLVAREWLAVAVDEAGVQSVIQAGLPQETVVAQRFRVRVEAAEVTFRSGASFVSLRANVTDERSPDRKAAVIYQGGLDAIVVSADGRLSSRVLIDHVELSEVQAAGSDASFFTSVADDLAGRNLEALQAFLPPIAIPVRLQQTLAIEGLSEGPVQVDGGELPVTAAVARVMPLSGRLWVFLDVKTGPWRKRGQASASASAGKRGP